MSGELVVTEQSLPSGDGASESLAFALPPAALSSSSSSRNVVFDADAGAGKAASTYFPASPPSPDVSVYSRSIADTKRPHAPAAASRQPVKRTLEDLDLPPPPTRTRKIIQMKPKMQTAATKAAGHGISSNTSNSTSASTSTTSTTSSGGGGKGSSALKETSKSSAAPAAAAGGSKKKQPSATSAAGRKIARKTAHSLIERRRRSKMNEEFSTLKNMIPACRGQEMHKLAILQVNNYADRAASSLAAYVWSPLYNESAPADIALLPTRQASSMSTTSSSVSRT